MKTDTKKNNLLESISVMVIDDNKHMRALIKPVLHALGVNNVILAPDGVSALQEVCSTPIDVIICDWNMPPLDGIDFVRTVRRARDSANPFVPIIMLTSSTQATRVTEARDAGVNEFLAKPISAKSLYMRMLAVVAHPRTFVRTREYFGPCRRRRSVMEYQGPERRKDLIAAKGLEPVQATIDMGTTPDIGALARALILPDAPRDGK